MRVRVLLIPAHALSGLAPVRCIGLAIAQAAVDRREHLARVLRDAAQVVTCDAVVHRRVLDVLLQQLGCSERLTTCTNPPPARSKS